MAAKRPPDDPRILAHRGASGHAPENTFAAFRKAAELGADWIETDSMLTRDGRVVLHHDDSLLRMTGLDRVVGDTDYADIRSLDAGSWFDPSFSGETIPTLEESIELFADLGLGANIEIKPCPGAEVETARATAAILSAHWPDSLPPPIISTFSREAFETAWPLLPNSPFSINWWHLPVDWRETMKHIGADAVHLGASNMQAGQAEEVVGEGVILRCFTVNDRAIYAKLLDQGVSGVYSDFPDRLLSP